MGRSAITAWAIIDQMTDQEQPHPQITYNDRYPGARVVLQSIYAVRYD